MIQLSNGSLRAQISTLGAELRSFTAQGRELLWQGDPAIWDGRAPVLFPFIGRCCEDSYLYGGKRYTIGLHGFAWKREFRIAEQTESRCVLELTEDAATLEVYPFLFTLRVGFTLEEDALRVDFRVHNRGDAAMPFALGWHPGFALPEGAPEHYLLCQENPRLEELKIVPKCMVTGETEPVSLTEGALPLSREMFIHSARVFRGADSSVALKNRRMETLVQMDCPGFSLLTLWQTLGSGAGFVCVEPWLGRPGSADTVEILGEDGKTVLPADGVLCRQIRVIPGLQFLR